MDKPDSQSLTRDIAPFGVRMPHDLKDRVKAAADANNRSMNSEIVATLEEKYPAPDPTGPKTVGELVALLDALLGPDNKDANEPPILDSIRDARAYLAKVAETDPDRPMGRFRFPNVIPPRGQ